MRERAADNRLVGLENSTPHGAVDTGEPSNVIGTAGAFYGTDTDGNLRVATEADKERTRLQYIEQAVAYTKDLNARAIDGRALLDGRIPDGYVAGDSVPTNCLAAHPDSRYFQNYYSTILCTCTADTAQAFQKAS